MKVEINTKESTIYLSANETANTVEIIDKWIETLHVVRRWLKKELEQKAKS
jgi:hypothetical protein